MSEIDDLQAVLALANAEVAAINAKIAQLQAAAPPPPPPNETLAITAVSPLAGPPGSPVTITGTGFGAAQGTGVVAMYIYGMAITSWSDTQIVADVPPELGVGDQVEIIVSLASGASLAYGSAF